MQFEKEYAVKQYQQMLEEHERDRQRQKEEDDKMKLQEEWQANQIAEFIDQLEVINEAEEEDTQEADLVLEDIIDDIALDALELHDSDSSGSDLNQDGLNLDDLEEDAIPDDPMQQDNNIAAFEFVGQNSEITKQSLALMESLRLAANSQMKSKVNPIDSYKQFIKGNKGQDAPPSQNEGEGSINQMSQPSIPLSQITMPPQPNEENDAKEAVEVDLPDEEE